MKMKIQMIIKIRMKITQDEKENEYKENTKWNMTSYKNQHDCVTRNKSNIRIKYK